MLPFLLAFIYATLYSFGIVGAANEGFTLEFWKEVWNDGNFFSSLFYSAIISAISLFLSVSFALYLTINYAKKLENKFVSYIIYMPLAMPGIVVAFFMLQVLSKAGFFSRILNKLGLINGIQSFPELINDQWAVGIVLAFFSVVMPFFLLLFLSVYKNERLAELKELAISLGAKPAQAKWRISLKLLLYKTKTLISIYFIFLLGAYEIPLILGQESPQMVSVLIVRELNQYDLSKISEGYVVAVMYTVIVSLFTIFLFANRKTEVVHA